MILQSQVLFFCPCNNFSFRYETSYSFARRCCSRRKRLKLCSLSQLGRLKFDRNVILSGSGVAGGGCHSGNKILGRLVKRRISCQLESQGFDEERGVEETLGSVPMGSNFTGFHEDPMVNKLRTQLGVIHPMPSPPINRNIVGLFVFFFFVGVVFDKVWTWRRGDKTTSIDEEGRRGVPTSFSLFLEKDLQRKESVEWVNMVLGKLWKVYRGGIENWIIGLLQPVIDDLKKPDYVERVEIKQFSLGDEPLSVRSVERRTSRRVNDLQ